MSLIYLIIGVCCIFAAGRDFERKSYGYTAIDLILGMLALLTMIGIIVENLA